MRKDRKHPQSIASIRKIHAFTVRMRQDYSRTVCWIEAHCTSFRGMDVHTFQVGIAKNLILNEFNLGIFLHGIPDYFLGN